MIREGRSGGGTMPRPLLYRQSICTRVTHWLWAVCLFFLLLSGLQIFDAHPALYVGQQSGFGFDNAVLSIDTVDTPDGPRGRTSILGHSFDTTGVLGLSGPADDPSFRGFPAALTIPSYQDLATGRVVHFFFAWLLVATLLVWLGAGLLDGHIRRDLIPTGRDLGDLPRDVADHARLRLRHGRGYKMTSLVLFFAVHVLMVLLAGPVNELRSMITGWYRTDPGPEREREVTP